MALNIERACLRGVHRHIVPCAATIPVTSGTSMWLARQPRMCAQRGRRPARHCQQAFGGHRAIPESARRREASGGGRLDARRLQPRSIQRAHQTRNREVAEACAGSKARVEVTALIVPRFFAAQRLGEISDHAREFAGHQREVGVELFIGVSGLALRILLENFEEGHALYLQQFGERE